MVSDNGPPFIGKELEVFCNEFGIKKMLTPPYHPRSNGLAERFVRSVKNALINTDSTNMERRLLEFLGSYRNAAHRVTQKTPAELLCKKIRRPLDGFKEKRDVHLKTRQTKYQPGQEVWYKTHKSGRKWEKGQINRNLGSFCYEVINDNYVCKRHQDQLQARGGKDDEEEESTNECNQETEEEIRNQIENKKEDDNTNDNVNSGEEAFLNLNEQARQRRKRKRPEWARDYYLNGEKCS